MTARVERQCDECYTLERLARSTGGTYRCTDCGAEFLGDARRCTPPPRTRAPAQRPADATRRVRVYVSEVLAWHAAVSRVDRRAVGARSSTGLAIDTLRAGVLGDGCSGTKRPGRASDEGELLHVDPVLSARYRALRGDALRVTNAVAADGQGDQIAPMTVGHRSADATLAQRIAMRLAPPEQIERWARKILARDSQPALAEAQVLGTQLLEQGAEAWWGVK